MHVIAKKKRHNVLIICVFLYNKCNPSWQCFSSSWCPELLCSVCSIINCFVIFCDVRSCYIFSKPSSWAGCYVLVFFFETETIDIISCILYIEMGSMQCKNQANQIHIGDAK